MTNFMLCPYCGSDLKSKQFGPLTCKCGWVDPTTERIKRAEAERKTVVKIVVVGIAILVAFAHMFSWGSYSFKIPFVRLQQVTGLLSADGYWELAQVCVNLNKWSCAENAHTRAFEKSKNPEYLEKLAKMQSQIGKNTESAMTYAKYFQVGGTNADAMIAYGKLLESQNRVSDALKFYQKSIDERPERLPVRATTAIVKIYIKQNRLKDALKRIKSFHNSAGNADSYLNDELEQVEDLLRGKRRAVASNK